MAVVTERALSVALFLSRAAWISAAICGLATAAVAIAAPPTISNLSLRGLQVGATTTLAIDGTNLLPQPQLLFPVPIARQTVRPGATATHVEIDVTLDAAVTAGIYHLRVATAGGVSAPVAFGLDALPERTMSSATTPLPPASLPAAFSGTLAGGQTADAVVTLKKDQQIAIEVEARRLGGALDPVIHVYDRRSVPLAWAEGTTALGGDARLTFVAAADGLYRIELHDAVYQAGNPGFYRLKIGPWYFAGMVFPPVVQRGTKATLEFADTNLPAGSKVEINMPAGAGDMPAPWPAGLQAAGFRPVVLASDVPEFVQLAPATGAAKGSMQQIVAPAGISGRLTTAKEDEYRVAVEPKERLRFEVLAARIGSPVDCVLTIRDEHGGQLAANDDQPGTVDPGLDFTVPGDLHAVVVAVKDVAGRGGPDCVYHLAVSQLDRADFSLSLADDPIEIPPGGMGLLRIAVRRTDYNGPIELSFQGLPPGVTVKDAAIDAGTDEALVPLSVADGPPIAGLVTVTGTATEDSTRMVRIAELPAAAETVWQPWLRSELAIARTGPPSIGVVWVNPAADPLFKPGEKVPLTVKFNRGATVSGKALAAGSTSGAVRLSLVSSQPMPEKKVRVKDKKKKAMQKEVDDPKRALRLDGAPMISPPQTDATAQLLIPGDLRPSEYELAIRAELLGADGKNVVATTYTPVMRINVAPPPPSAKTAKTKKKA